MDRTYRLQRRTFLCAAFACPLSAVSLYIGWLVMALFALTLCTLPESRPSWVCKHSPPVLRVVFSASAALFFSAFLSALTHGIFPFLHIATAAFVRVLSVFSALSLQCALLHRVRFARLPHRIAAVLFLLGFIVCMRSAA